MSADPVGLAAVGLCFLVIVVSGIWLSRSGRPLNGIVLTVHKLVALAAAIYVVITIYHTYQATGLGGLALAAGVIAGLLFLGTGATGGALSTDKAMPAAVLRLHQFGSALTVITTALTFYLLLGS
jgi:hypothetical protein